MAELAPLAAAEDKENWGPARVRGASPRHGSLSPRSTNVDAARSTPSPARMAAKPGACADDEDDDEDVYMGPVRTVERQRARQLQSTSPLLPPPPPRLAAAPGDEDEDEVFFGPVGTPEKRRQAQLARRLGNKRRRTLLYRPPEARLEEAVVRVQAAVRAWLARRRFVTLRRVTVELQRRFRGRRALVRAVQLAQRLERGRQARRRAHRLRRMVAASTTLQRWWRRHLAARRRRRELQEQRARRMQAPEAAPAVPAAGGNTERILHLQQRLQQLRALKERHRQQQQAWRQQQQHKQVQPAAGQDEPPRAAAAFVARHRRTPSGVPQWHNTGLPNLDNLQSMSAAFSRDRDLEDNLMAAETNKSRNSIVHAQILQPEMDSYGNFFLPPDALLAIKAATHALQRPVAKRAAASTTAPRRSLAWNQTLTWLVHKERKQEDDERRIEERFSKSKLFH